MSEQAQNLNACRHSLGKPALLLFLGMELGRRGVGKGPTSLSVQQSKGCGCRGDTAGVLHFGRGEASKGKVKPGSMSLQK